MEDNETYYLISESTIETINSKIVILNRAAQFMKNEGFDNFAETVVTYGVEIGTLINSASKCDVIPRNKVGDNNE